MEFGALHEAVFNSGDRFRASDKAYVISYRLIENYQSTWKREPTRRQVLNVLRRKYNARSGHKNQEIAEKFLPANAFWYAIYQDTGAWQVRYGFGEAYCALDRLS